MGASFRRQYSVSKYFADYCCVPLKLVVEIDGIAHDAVADSIRDHRINERGFDVLRFTVQESTPISRASSRPSTAKYSSV
jgi:very-short-patch-repair endonuclease